MEFVVVGLPVLRRDPEGYRSLFRIKNLCRIRDAVVGQIIFGAADQCGIAGDAGPQQHQCQGFK